MPKTPQDYWAEVSARLFEAERCRARPHRLARNHRLPQRTGQEGSPLEEEFEEAAEKYRVPKELLLAIGYVNYYWEMPLHRQATMRRASSMARALAESWPSSGALRRTP